MTEYVHPTTKQFWDIIKLPSTGPIDMLYLIQLNERADYPDGREATGTEAYKAYFDAVGPIVLRVGGKVIWRGEPESMMVGPVDEKWDSAFITRFPSMAGFSELVEDLGFHAAAVHRQAAMKDSRLMLLKPLSDEFDFDRFLSS